MHKNMKKATPYLLLFPIFIYYAVFWLAPVASGIKEVFVGMDGDFTLTENLKLMFRSDLFSESVLNTAAFAAISVVLQYVIALVRFAAFKEVYRIPVPDVYFYDSDGDHPYGYGHFMEDRAGEGWMDQFSAYGSAYH